MHLASSWRALWTAYSHCCLPLSSSYPATDAKSYPVWASEKQLSAGIDWSWGWSGSLKRFISHRGQGLLLSLWTVLLAANPNTSPQSDSCTNFGSLATCTLSRLTANLFHRLCASSSNLRARICSISYRYSSVSEVAYCAKTRRISLAIGFRHTVHQWVRFLLWLRRSTLLSPILTSVLLSNCDRFGSEAIAPLECPWWSNRCIWAN